MDRAVFAVVGALGLAFGSLGGPFGAAAAIFAAQIAYEGVRVGRKLHLTDMAEDAFRARYTALSNTLIGLALLAGGLFGPAPVLLAFAVIAAFGAVLARGLDEVQQDPDVYRFCAVSSVRSSHPTFESDGVLAARC